MPKNRPSLVHLSEENIINAIGKTKSFSEESKRVFASGLVEELERVFTADSKAFPDRKIVDSLNMDLDSLTLHLMEVRRLSKKVRRQANKYSFVASLLAVCSRAVAKLKYKADIVDVLAFSEVALKAAKHVRFQNKKLGPDSRLATEITLIIARRYQKAFGELPGISGMGNREDGKSNASPFQRVCRTISATIGIKGIGKSTQRDAIAMLKEGMSSPWAFFRPDVKYLRKKELD